MAPEKLLVSAGTCVLRKPLSADDDFSDPTDGPEISAGGGQMMSCRDHLRVSQLLINRGRWFYQIGNVMEAMLSLQHLISMFVMLH